MTVLDVNNVCKRFDIELLLDGVSFKLSRGEKVGLIGGNGCGKTTLLKMIAGIEDPSSGVITRPGGSRVGYLAQEPAYDEGRTVGEELLEAFSEISGVSRQLKFLEQRLESAPADEEEAVLAEYSRVSARLEQLGGYSFEHKVDAVLEGLQMASMRQRSLNSLSGGEKNAVALARILLEEPDILLLDEPGNHLDFEGLEWLEGFLRTYEKTVLLVSHNRYLLDRVVDGILEIENGRVARYKGNYSAYRVEKLRESLKQKAAFDDQQKEIRRLEAMIRRFALWAKMTEDGRHARQARSRQKMLDRMDRVERPNLGEGRIQPRLGAAERAGKIALELRGYSKAFGEKVLFDSVDLHLSSGERVGLLGPNGSGKSTIFRDIVERGSWENPVVRIGPRIEVGYYSQEHETLNPANSLVEEIREAAPMTEDQAFHVLLKFLFRREDIHRAVSTLSGGEKSRIQLARLKVSDVNLLLLDEPTNHLDIHSREQVEEALEEFDGTILAISHDRYFLDRIVDRIVEVRNPTLVEYAGSFSEFWAKRRRDRVALPEKVRKGKVSGAGKKAAPRTQTRKSSAATTGIEQKIEGLEGDKLKLEEEIVEAYQDRRYDRGEKLSRDLQRLEKEIERLYAEWETAS